MRKPPGKRKLSKARYAARFAAEKGLQQRRYCDAFALWRQCPLKRCRRERACRGDQNLCLKGALDRVPRHSQWQARQKLFYRDAGQYRRAGTRRAAVHAARFLSRDRRTGGYR